MIAWRRLTVTTFHNTASRAPARFITATAGMLDRKPIVISTTAVPARASVSAGPEPSARLSAEARPSADDGSGSAGHHDHGELDRRCAEDLLGVQHVDRERDRRRGVEQAEDQRHRPQQLVAPQPAHAFDQLLAPRAAGGDDGPPRRRCDQRDQRRRHGERSGVEHERHGEADGEQQRAQRRSGELVGGLLPGPQPAVRLLQLLAVDDRRHQRLRAVVVEHLTDAEQQRGSEHAQVERRVGPGDLVELVRAGQVLAAERHGERHEQRHGGAAGVRRDHQPAAVVAVGEHAGRQGEQQPRQPLHHDDESDQHGIAGDRRGQPRVGDEGDAVAEVGDRRGGEQPLVVAAETVAAAGSSRRSLVLHGRVWTSQCADGRCTSELLAATRRARDADSLASLAHTTISSIETTR